MGSDSTTSFWNQNRGKMDEDGRHQLDEEDRSHGPAELETLESEPSPSVCSQTSSELGEPPGSKPSFDQTEICKAVEVVERDSVAIAQSFVSLFASLRLVLSEVTSSSLDHMHCFSDAAGSLQESVLDAATKGNRYINSCLRLNEEIKDIDRLAMQLKVLRRNVDALDSAANKLLRLP